MSVVPLRCTLLGHSLAWEPQLLLRLLTQQLCMIVYALWPPQRTVMQYVRI